MREEGTTPPSSRAVQRLASDVGSEVSDLRMTLRRALVEADRHEAEGRPERAAAVLVEQREVLAAVHRRLEDRLADAAVEREAEGVLAAAGQTAPRSARSVGATEAVAVPRGDDEGMGLRMLASAAAAVVGLVLLLAPEAGGMLTVAGWSAIEEGRATDAGRTGEHDDPVAAADETTSVVPTWPVLHELAIPEAFELRPAPVLDDPARGPDVDRTGRSPSDPVDGPVGEVLDELGDLDELATLEDLASAGLEASDGVDQETRAADQHDEQQDGASADGSQGDTGSGSTREPDGSTSGDESVGTDDDRDGSQDGEGGSTGSGAEDDTSTASDGDASEAQDDQQDDAEPEGSSTTSGLSSLAPSDDETTGAGR